MTTDELKDLMMKNKSIIITYECKTSDTGQRLTRLIDPLVLGHTKTGEVAVRAYQRMGGSHHTPLGFRIFLLSNIFDYKIEGTMPSTPPPLYRQDGDDDLNPIIFQVKFPLTQTVEEATEPTPANDVITGAFPLLDLINRIKKNLKRKR